MIKNNKDSTEYGIFKESQESVPLIIAWGIILGLLIFPFALYQLIAVQFTGLGDKNTMLNVVLNFVFSLMVLIFLIIFLLIKTKRLKSLNESDKCYLRLLVFKNLFVFMLTFSQGYRLLSRVMIGQCPAGNSNTYLDTWYCNNFQDRGGLPTDTLLSLIIAPIAASIVLNCSWNFQIINFMFSILCFLLTGLFINLRFTVPILLTYCFSTCILIYEGERRMKNLFILNQQIRNRLEENVRRADENHANELRSMIGNVAHDLKTPLMSFLTGIELVGNILDELTESLTDEGVEVHEILNYSSSIRSCMENMHDVNSFMTMTINRCIDYTKASKGFKLMPKLVTLDLSAAMELPVKIMRNMQTRIEIKWEEFMDRGICSHIISDQQWLQENLLCLLSNAVKYSSSGVVEVRVGKFLYSEKKDTFTPKVKDNSWKSRVLLKLRAIKAFSGKSKIFAVDDVDVDVEASFKSKVKETSVHSVSSTVHQVAPPAPALAQTTNTSLNPIDTHSDHEKDFKDLESGLKNSRAENYSLNEITYDWRRHPFNRTSTGQKSKRSHSDDGQDDEVTEVLRFSVHDCGIGLSDEAMKSLFAPFKQAQRLAGGTGLGLFSLAKRVEALQGQCGVERRSDGQEGSVFWFSIPYRPDALAENLSKATRHEREKRRILLEQKILSREHSEESESPRKFSLVDNVNEHIRKLSKSTVSVSHSLSFSPRTNFSNVKHISLNSPAVSSPVCRGFQGAEKLAKPLRVLLVDDALPIIKMTRMLLKKQGHSVEVAENGLEALKKVFKESEEAENGEEDSLDRHKDYPYFDVVLMDLQMPLMDGLEATKRLREREQTIRLLHEQLKETKTSGKEFDFLNSPGVTSLYGSQDTIDNEDQEFIISENEDNGHEKIHPLPTIPSGHNLKDSGIVGYNSRIFPSVEREKVVDQRHQLVIGVSANSDYDTMEEALREGMDDFIAKPFSIDQFYKTLSKYHKDY